MRGVASSLVRNGQLGQLGTRSSYICRQCRAIQISAAPTADTPSSRDPFAAPVGVSRDVADARFEVLGTSYSLLSVTLSASQRLYTRRGTLVAVSGKAQNHRLPLAHWGSSELTGRGLAALSAPGHIYQLTLGDGEEFVAHPANVIAYTITKQPPLPFRFKSSSIRFQIPSVTTWLETTKFFQNMRQTETYKFLTRLFYSIRTTARRTIWGDRLFLQFRGPMTILMSSRGSRVSDVLTNVQVNEIADAPAGAVPAAMELATKPKVTEEPVKTQDAPVKISVASVGQDGKVKFEDAKSLKEFEK
ncbi:hypothetical protein ONZ43_g2954 [Nemania bipapillata]|uniref:Uncharacterized protein n=1 Tax=Nemania bipapillata TaxID=110536 RepID=A0ACC2IYM0_9PEZI|nr:hypothetical protein ONZ43_g2954 [Nemania bipapillata]